MKYKIIITIDCESKTELLSRWSELLFPGKGSSYKVVDENGKTLIEKEMEQGDFKTIVEWIESAQQTHCENGACSIDLN